MVVTYAMWTYLYVSWDIGMIWTGAYRTGETQATNEVEFYLGRTISPLFRPPAKVKLNLSPLRDEKTTTDVPFLVHINSFRQSATRNYVG